MVEFLPSCNNKRNFLALILVSAALSSIISVPSQAFALPSGSKILVLDLDAGTNFSGLLFSVDPTTGARTIISEFGVGANQGDHPEDFAVDASRQILVVDFVAGTNFRGLLFSVDPTTGARTIISDFGVGANQGNTPFDVAVDASGQILVLDPNAGPALRGVLFSVDPTTVAGTIISDFGARANRGLET